MSTEEIVAAFYTGLQTSIQTKVMDVLMEHGDAAEEADMSIGDAAFCLGSSVASVLYEMFREEDQITMTPEQVGIMKNLRETMMTAFDEKIEILSDAHRMNDVAASRTLN